MSQVLNIELSEEVFAAIQRQAKSAGISPAHWVADMLENHYRFSSKVSEERQKARLVRRIVVLAEDPLDNDDAGDRVAFHAQVSLKKQATDPMGHTPVQSYANLSGSYSLPANPMVAPFSWA
jgi:hypothetical protein